MLPADRRGRIRRDERLRHHPGIADVAEFGTAGQGDRCRPVRLHGAQEAGRLFLMAGQAVVEAQTESVAEAGAGRRLLRVLTCGSVDNGKSTLIGRMLHECGAILEDQISALEKDSRRYGTTGEEIDFALLLDG